MEFDNTELSNEFDFSGLSGDDLVMVSEAINDLPVRDSLGDLNLERDKLVTDFTREAFRREVLSLRSFSGNDALAHVDSEVPLRGYGVDAASLLAYQSGDVAGPEVDIEGRMDEIRVEELVAEGREQVKMMMDYLGYRETIRQNEGEEVAAFLVDGALRLVEKSIRVTLVKGRGFGVTIDDLMGRDDDSEAVESMFVDDGSETVESMLVDEARQLIEIIRDLEESSKGESFGALNLITSDACEQILDNLARKRLKLNHVLSQLSAFGVTIDDLM